MTKINTIFELLDSSEFRRRIEMYIGDRKITTLDNFLNGAFFTLKIYEIENDPNRPDFQKFHDFVSNYYDREESTMGWKNIILNENKHEEEKALNEFFRLYDEFISKYNKYCS